MSILGFKASNHPQQTAKHGASDEIDDRGTHPNDFGPLNERFGFTLDAAAAPHNAKCKRYFTRADDGLEQSWAGEMVWCNPPYSDIGAWVRKAHDEAGSAVGIVMLLPANRTEQGWWQDWVEPYRDRYSGRGIRVEFLRGRMRFIKAGRIDVGPNERPPFGNCLLIWEGGVNWKGPECQMCNGTGVAQMNSGDGTGAHYVRCPACNGHGRDAS